ncbi:MAG: type I 3-dehydroquinate dehydratase [Candidatus Lokiarchaeota archaeon]|nr:type I 3-dehydroquinate dehydratase [Candidatus Lokiarchaeota archaeon]MBD3343376.1 type I 3-dehydroquinate dehydratase [Candidatus Lokiarchaeota archaeon]
MSLNEFWKLCVALKITSGDIKGISELIEKVVDLNPDYVELRFDFIDEIHNLTPILIETILSFIKPPIKSIFTFRHHKEGGSMELDDFERFKILKLLIESRPSYFDLEMNTNIETLRNIIALANENDVSLIFSYHNFEKTPSYEEALVRVENFKNLLLNNHLIDFLFFKRVIYKVIFTAQEFKDNLIPLKLCRTISKKERDQGIVSFCMGEKGLFSRIMCVKTGSAFTYSSFNDITAPGQISFHNMREIYNLLFQNE